MKNIVPVFGLFLILCGCGEDAPPSKSGSYTPPAFKKSESTVVSPAQSAPAAQTTQPASAAADPAKDTKGTTMQRPATQIINNASATVDYGMGATPISAKQKQSDKIQSIQNQHNQDMQKALK